MLNLLTSGKERSAKSSDIIFSFQWLRRDIPVIQVVIHPPLWAGLFIMLLQTLMNYAGFLTASLFFPSVLSISLTPSISLPFGTDALLFLYPPTCFTHTHLLSVSHWATFWSRERERQRENYWWKGIAVFLITCFCAVGSSLHPCSRSPALCFECSVCISLMGQMF